MVSVARQALFPTLPFLMRRACVNRGVQYAESGRIRFLGRATPLFAPGESFVHLGATL